MSRSRLEFFALPNEQRQWLNAFVTQPQVWCVVRGSGVEQFRLVSSVVLARTSFHAPSRYALEFIIGHRDLTDGPVWRLNEQGTEELDFIRSQAVQFMPSVLARKTILLDGQLAIMRPEDYEDAGVHPNGVRKWFWRMLRSFRELKSSDAVVIQHTTLGRVKRWPNYIITPGAVNWHRSGKHLKQFPDGLVEFHIEHV